MTHIVLDRLIFFRPRLIRAIMGSHGESKSVKRADVIYTRASYGVVRVRLNTRINIYNDM